jgi:hypothetical protein
MMLRKPALQQQVLTTRERRDDGLHRLAARTLIPSVRSAPREAGRESVALTVQKI